MSTVLCLMPPRPADWIKWDVPSRRLEDTTSWQNPLVFSTPIRDRMFCRRGKGQRTAPSPGEGPHAGSHNTVAVPPGHCSLRGGEATGLAG
jgi:hypothetical protein